MPGTFGEEDGAKTPHAKEMTSSVLSSTILARCGCHDTVWHNGGWSCKEEVVQL